MMSQRLVAAAAALLLAAACSKNFDNTISCASDSNCPTGSHCGSSGKCQSGEAVVQVSWVTPSEGSAMKGAQTFRVAVSHPDGVQTVRLLAGTLEVGTFTAPSGGLGAGGPVQVDIPVDTSTIADGNVTLNATGTSAKGQSGGGATRAFLVDNHERTPALTTTTPASPNNTLDATFLLKGMADVGPAVAPSTVYVFTEPTCNGGDVGGALASGSAATLVEPGIALPVVPDAATSYFAISVDSLGNVSPCSVAFTYVNDRAESQPTISASNPPPPNNTTAAAILISGFGASTGPSATTVYAFKDDDTCGGAGFPAGNVGSADGATFNDATAGITIPLAPNAVSKYFVRAQDAAGNATGCSGPFVFTNFQSVAAPEIVATNPASPSNTWAQTINVSGTVDPSHPHTVFLFAGDPTCGGAAFPAGALASGTSADFQAPGFSVPYSGGATTNYFAQAQDVEGNVSGCSAALGFVSNRSSLCATVTTPPLQAFSALMQGCGGKVTFANRANLCAPGCRAATAEEWVANFGGVAPTHHYWTDDPLNFSSAGSCGPAGCNTNNCFATRGLAQSLSCAVGQPMRVCAGNGVANGVDPDGNTCTWSACGYNSIAPKQFFGGCSGVADATAGTLCVCNIRHWFVSTTGNNANSGTSAASPFRTITKALSVATSGNTVLVRPGTYDAAGGETFPLHPAAGVILVGDEPNRGNAAGSPTRIGGTINPGAGATVAGFLIGSAGDGILANSAGLTIRNNTFTGNGGFAIEATNAGNHLILLNAFVNNVGEGILYRSGAGGGKGESNTFTGNTFGIEFDGPGADFGGGPAGSVGNNVFSCNSQTDMWMVATVAVTASSNKWDHAPPSTNAADVRAGVDFFTQAGATVTGNASSINSGATVAPAPICP